MNSWTIEDHRCGVQRQRRSLVRQFQTLHGQPFPNSNWRGFVLQLTGGNNRLLSMTKLTFQSHIFPSDSCLCTASARSITTPLKWTTKFECRRRAMSTSATATWAVGARSSTKPAARLRLKIRYGNFLTFEFNYNRIKLISQNIGTSTVTTHYTVTPNRGYAELATIKSSGIIVLDPFSTANSAVVSKTK